MTTISSKELVINPSQRGAVQYTVIRVEYELTMSRDRSPMVHVPMDTKDSWLCVKMTWRERQTKQMHAPTTTGVLSPSDPTNESNSLVCRVIDVVWSPNRDVLRGGDSSPGTLAQASKPHWSSQPVSCLPLTPTVSPWDDGDEPRSQPCYSWIWTHR